MRWTAALASVTLAALAEAELPSNEQLASYGLILSEFELIKASESPYDFDHTDQDQIWLDAAIFAYDISAARASDGTSSLSYMPYVVCNESPDVTGQERILQIEGLFRNTSGIESTDFYHDNAVVNGEVATCLLMRAYNDTITLVYGENPGVEEWLKVQPLHQSMKMNNSTVETIRKRFDNIESEDYVLPDDPSTWFKLVNVLGSQSLICPGVSNFGGKNVTDQEIQDAVKNFITGDDGSHVKDASFFYQRLNGDSDSDIITDRMEMWAEIISDVDNMLLESGTNYCRENIIDDHMIFKMDKDNLNVYAKFSTDEIIKLAENQGLAQGEVEKCALYLAMGLSLNPMICSVEPITQVKVLCPDGTSDLTKCPEPEPEIPVSSCFGIERGLRFVMLSVVVIFTYFV